jgi:hypothetical protein
MNIQWWCIDEYNELEFCVNIDESPLLWNKIVLVISSWTNLFWIMSKYVDLFAFQHVKIWMGISITYIICYILNPHLNAHMLKQHKCVYNKGDRNAILNSNLEISWIVFQFF